MDFTRVPPFGLCRHAKISILRCLQTCQLGIIFGTQEPSNQLVLNEWVTGERTSNLGNERKKVRMKDRWMDVQLRVTEGTNGWLSREINITNWCMNDGCVCMSYRAPPLYTPLMRSWPWDVNKGRPSWISHYLIFPLQIMNENWNDKSYNELHCVLYEI